ncbi:hypothetical protein Micbo1qcDRAFT_181510, partial [Microdochium bolleyi]
MTAPKLSDPEAQGSDQPSLADNDGEHVWCFNACMRFPDRPWHIKIFTTYWKDGRIPHRLNISIDYTNVPVDSLEHRIASATSGEEKASIFYGYQGIQDSLQDAKLFETATLVRPKTTDDRIHLCYAEDGWEIIDFPKKQHLTRTFPLSHREVGAGFAIATCLVFAAALGLTWPLLLLI